MTQYEIYWCKNIRDTSYMRCSTYKFTKINQILFNIKDIWCNCKPKTKLISRSFLRIPLLETLILYRHINTQDKTISHLCKIQERQLWHSYLYVIWTRHGKLNINYVLKIKKNNNFCCFFIIRLTLLTTQ